jgi:hypothetical protein
MVAMLFINGLVEVRGLTWLANVFPGRPDKAPFRSFFCFFFKKRSLIMPESEKAVSAYSTREKRRFRSKNRAEIGREVRF